MGLAEDLLVQAHHLAALDRGRPKQAKLRRAVSSAYYALFHLLVASAVLEFIPKKPVGLIPRVGRAFSHAEIKQACFAFQRKPLNEPLRGLIGSTVSSESEMVANIFIELQEARHAADYDTAAVFSRTDVLGILAKAESAFANCHHVSGRTEARVFLAAITFGARWNK